jgi:hypothetical protein
MKHYLLLISLIASISTSAQQGDNIFLRTDSIYFYSRSQTSPEPVFTRRTEYFYNSAGVLVSAVSNIGSSPTDIESVIIINYVVNDQNQVTDVFQMRQPSPNASFVNQLKKEVSYNANGQVSEVILFEWLTSNNNWLPETKTIFTYDGENVIQEDILNYNPIAQDFFIGSRVTREFQPNGSYTEVLSYIGWPKEEFPSAKEIITFNDMGQLESVVFGDWDVPTLSWEYYRTLTAEYDAEGNVQLVRSDLENDPITGLPGIYEEYYNYNYDYTLEQCIQPTNNLLQLEANWRKHITRQRLYSDGDFSYLNPQTLEVEAAVQRIVYFNSEVQILSIAEETSESPSVYPNPANEAVYLSFKNPGQVQLELYDMAGQRVQSTLIANNGWLSTAELPNGIYLYKAQQNNVAYTGKLVVQH